MVRSPPRPPVKTDNAMNIPHQRLVYFRVTVEAGSLRGAARRFGIAPSAVGRQIRLLEEALGATLLERSPRGMRATQTGEMVLAYCQARHRLDDDLAARLAAHQRLETGTIALAVGEGFVSDLVATPLRDFTERYRGICLDIEPGSTDAIIDRVVDDRAHIGLIYHERRHPQLRFQASSAQPLMAILSPAHPLAAVEVPLSPARLGDVALVSWKPGHGVRQLVDRAFRGAGGRPRSVVETGSMSVLRQAVLANMGMTFLPAFAVARELGERTLVARPVACEAFQKARAHMITRIGRSQPRAALKLLRHLSRWMQAFQPPVP